MTPLMYAVKDNRSALLDRMIELGSDVGARNNASIPAMNKINRSRSKSPFILDKIPDNVNYRAKNTCTKNHIVSDATGSFRDILLEAKRKNSFDSSFFDSLPPR